MASGTDVIADGYLRVTSTGLIQVDLDGGGDDWASLSTVNGNGAVSIRYLSDGTPTKVSASRVAESSAAQAMALDDAREVNQPFSHAEAGWLL